MTAKGIAGIIILALNLTGVCFMTIMILIGLRKKSAKNFPLQDGAMERKEPKTKKKRIVEPILFNKADYLLDDLDLSEFDDLDLDFDQNQNQNQKR
ncbi:MAG: hypothetical protein RBR67_07580 [Desulfobacterium sp.]|jgi:hypothetical protein|nr:hypothetical protein [Desulfobacterium sp.]